MINANQPPMAPVCCLCQNGFREPKVLPCLHTFCANCLSTRVTESSSPEVMCPTCGCHVTLPATGVSGLMTNSIVKRLADNYFDELKNSLYGQGDESSEPDEGFGEHSIGTMTRSVTWHGQPTLTKPSDSVHTEPALVKASLQSLTTVVTSEEDVSETPQPSESPEEVQARLEKKKEACRITGKLMNKLLHLQGEALRLTYSIDTVNQSVQQWNARNAEIKSQIIDRSLMLQHIIRRHEQKMLAEVDNLETHEEFLNEVDRSKAELRGNLKRVLNAVEFLKHAQNFAVDEDLIEMKDFLLGDLKIMSSVETSKTEYILNMPSLPSDETFAAEFGKLTSVQKTSSVFEPEPVSGNDDVGSMKLTQVEKVKQMEFANPANSRLSRRRRAKTQQIHYQTAQSKEVRFSSPHRQTRRLSDAKLSDSAIKDSESETRPDIRDLQETLKQRRRELLQEKQAEGNVQNVQLFNVTRRPGREKKRRVQSFGGRASSRTRVMEQAAMAFRVPSDSHQTEKQKCLDKTDSMESVDEETVTEEGSDVKPQAKDDISTKLKYLREGWKRRREILRSSESLGPEEVSPNSPISPKSDDKENETNFPTLKDTNSSVKQQLVPGDVKVSSKVEQTPFQRKSDSWLTTTISSVQTTITKPISSFGYSTSQQSDTKPGHSDDSTRSYPYSSARPLHTQSAVVSNESLKTTASGQQSQYVSSAETSIETGGTVTKPTSSYPSIYSQKTTTVASAVTTTVASAVTTTSYQYQSPRFLYSKQSDVTYGGTGSDNRTGSQSSFGKQVTSATTESSGSYQYSYSRTMNTRTSDGISSSESMTTRPSGSTQSAYSYQYAPRTTAESTTSVQYSSARSIYARPDKEVTVTKPISSYQSTLSQKSAGVTPVTTTSYQYLSGGSSFTSTSDTAAAPQVSKSHFSYASTAASIQEILQRQYGTPPSASDSQKNSSLATTEAKSVTGFGSGQTGSRFFTSSMNPVRSYQSTYGGQNTSGYK